MNQCIFCNRTITVELSLSFLLSFSRLKTKRICVKCFGKFHRINQADACQGCSRPKITQDYCGECQLWLQRYPNLHLRHTALYRYNDIAKEYMEQFKFQGDLLIGDAFEEELHERLLSYTKTHNLVPIPLSRNSVQERGFNQVEVLLKAADIPYVNWLKNVSTGKKQSKKTREDRLTTKQPFVLNERAKNCNLFEKSILLVDDVYTTGRTLVHAKNIFKNTFKTNAKHNNQKKHCKIESFSLFR